MAIGKVKWFNNAKGYGFVLPEDGGEDLFAHFSAIQMEGYKTLKAGQDVLYDVVPGPKGMHAVNIRLNAAVPTEVTPVAAVEPEYRNGDDHAHEPVRNGTGLRAPAAGFTDAPHSYAAAGTDSHRLD